MSRISRLVALALTALLVVGGLVTSPSPATADGSEMTGGTPQALAGRISAGDKHSCVITSDSPTVGRVFCWGNNALGQLGLGDTTNRGDQPGEMGNALPGAELGGQATSLSAGAAHTCAVLAGGSVKCWGYNSSGQLGIGDTATRGDGPGEMGAALPTVDLGPGRTAVSVAVGVEFSCAVLDNGSVKCWGGNTSGQLGLGDTANRGDQPGEMGASLPAIDLGPGRTAITVVAGGAFACALLDTHAVKCWGNNDNGQLGLGDTADRGDQPDEMGAALPTIDLGPSVTARAISAGRFHSCALVTVRSVKCWGDNAFGQLGLGDTADRGDGPGEMGTALTGILFDVGIRFEGITTTGFGTCVVGPASSPRCFGANAKGQLNLAHPNDTSEWEYSESQPSNALAGGLDHMCWTRADGTVRCVGSNDSGQLGQGDTVERGGDVLSTNPPAIVLRRSTVPTALSAGSDSTCVIVDDGVLRCVGGNGWGQLGQGDIASRGSDVATNGDLVAPIDLGTGRSAVSVSVGEGNVCAILDNGSLKCWGRNDTGLLGLGDTAHRGDQPGEMGDALPPIDLGTGRTAVEVGNGQFVTCARLDNGQVKCWGEGAFGALGQGDQNDRGAQPNEMGDALPPIDLGAGRSAIDLAVGYLFVCALLDDHSVKCWGYYDNAQIGWTNFNYIGNSPGEMGDALTPLDLGTGRTALQIDAEESVCAVLDDHTVKCWGLNDYGEVGRGSIGRWGNDPTHWGDNLPAVPLGTGRTALAVAVGNRQSCAILDNGTAKCWGNNSVGQLGIDSEINHGDGTGAMGDALPAVILPGDTPVAVSVGRSHSCALLQSSKVKCWGQNNVGQLGIASTTSVFGHFAGSMTALPYLDTGGTLNRVLPAPTSPGFPDDVAVTPGNGTVSITWSAPDDGGLPIAAYRVERSADGGVHWSTAVGNTASSATTTVVSGLTNGISLQFRVAATNAIGTGPVSAPSTAVTPSTVPASPTAISGIAGDAKANLTWTAPANGGAAITGYRVDRSTNNGASWVTVVTNTGSTNTVAVVTGLSNFVPVRFRVAALNVNGAGAPSAAAPSVTPVTTKYWPVRPFRLADTRPGAKTGDAKGAGTGLVPAKGVLKVAVAGRAGVPIGSKAAALQLTVLNPAAAGEALVWPCGATRPNATTVAFGKGVATSNSVISKLGIGGTVCVYTTVAAHLVVDVVGAHPAGTTYLPLNPFRLADTRPASKTGDGKAAGTGAVKAGGVLAVTVAGRGGVPATAKVAVLNVTVSTPMAGGRVTVYACGATRPSSPTVVFAAGASIANVAIVKVGTFGRVCVHSTVATHVRVDVAGAYSTTTSYVPVAPYRLASTKVAAKGTLTVVTAGRGGVPAGASAATLTIMVTNAAGPGTIVVHACGGTRPLTSNTTFQKATTVAGTTVAQISATGTVCVYSTAAATITVDVVGRP